MLLAGIIDAREFGDCLRAEVARLREEHAELDRKLAEQKAEWEARPRWRPTDALWRVIDRIRRR